MALATSRFVLVALMGLMPMPASSGKDVPIFSFKKDRSAFASALPDWYSMPA